MPSSTETFEQATVAKITRKIVPLMMLLYIVAYIDRQNIGFAKLHMADSLKLSDTAFGLGASLFFIGYLIFEVPSNVILSRVGARLWFTRILFSWGLVTLLLAFTSGQTMFYILRFLLGAAEAGLYPGLIYFTTQWFPLKYRPRIIGYLVGASLVANIIGAPINGNLLEMHGLLGLDGWQWLFLGTGALALILVPFIIFKFPDRPENAAFLTGDEKAWLNKTISAEEGHNTDHSVSGLIKSLTDSRVLMLALVLWFISFGAYGLSYWMPTIVKSFGVTDSVNGFINAIPWILSALLLWWLTAKPSRTANPVLNVAMPMFTAAIFLAVSVLLSSSPVLSFASLCLVVLSIFAIQPCFWSMTKFLSGTAAAAGIATINSLANLGGFVAQNAVPIVKDMTGSITAPVLFLSVCMVIGGVTTLAIIGALKRSEARQNAQEAHLANGRTA